MGGVHLAIAKRTMSLARRVNIEPLVTMTGGVARNVGMVRALETCWDKKSLSPRTLISWERWARRCFRWRSSAKVLNPASGGNMPLVAGIDCGSGFTKALVARAGLTRKRASGSWAEGVRAAESMLIRQPAKRWSRRWRVMLDQT